MPSARKVSSHCPGKFRALSITMRPSLVLCPGGTRAYTGLMSCPQARHRVAATEVRVIIKRQGVVGNALTVAAVMCNPYGRPSTSRVKESRRGSPEDPECTTSASAMFGSSGYQYP